MPRDAEAVFEADYSALIQTEQVAGVLAEAAAVKVAIKSVRELKARSVNRQPQRGRQVDDAEIRPGQLQRSIVVVGGRGRLAGGVCG